MTHSLNKLSQTQIMPTIFNMASKEITIAHGNSKSIKLGVKGCNDTWDYTSTTWSITDDSDFSGININGSAVNGVLISTDSSTGILTCTNNSTSTDEKYVTVEGTSLGGCTKDCEFTIEGKEVVKDYCPTATIELYDSGNNIISGGEGAGNSLYIKITVTDWKDVPESNKYSFGSYDNGGNNITISYPSCYVGGYSSWSGNSYSILGGLSGTNCADGEYSFSITICGQTYTKKYTKKTTTVTYTCPTASFSTTSTKCDIYSTTTIYVNVTNWGSVTSGNYNSWGSKSGNNLKIIADTDKNKNYSYEIGDYDSRFKQFYVIIRHEKASNCSDNYIDDGLRLHLACVSSGVTLSSVTISPNYGNFVTTFNKMLSGNNAIEIYIKRTDKNCTENIAVMHSSATLTQEISIWRSILDLKCFGANCDNSCTSVSFTIGWLIRGTVNIRRITANGAILTGSESNTFTLNPCTSSDFNVSVDFY